MVEQADAFEWLKAQAAGSADLIITDPPYESLEKHRKIGTTTRLTGQWFDIMPNERFPELMTECYRVLKKDRHMYLFCDQETMFIAVPAAVEAGFKFWKPIVWDKVAIGMGYHYRARYEFILFFEKGKRKLNDLGQADIITHKRIVGGYPTEKPVEVSEVLVKQSTQPGELVIDPFCGSGSSLVAALKHGRKAAGCDSSAAAIERAAPRLGTIAGPWRGLDAA